MSAITLKFSDWFRFRSLFTALAVMVLVTGCATQPKSGADGSSAQSDDQLYEAEYDNDPVELLNRFTFSFNLALDTFIFKPAAATYRFLLPTEVRDSVRNALRNLRTPVVLANDLFQGELDRAGDTIIRFAINSTIGILGLFDVADDMGYPYHDEDFGQTLAVHGAGEGAYLVIPILGPSSIRDGIGTLVDYFLDPLTYVAQAYDAEDYLLARTAVAGIDKRSRYIETLDDMKKDSIDFYARIRSLYRQTRTNDINNGEDQGDSPTPGLYSLDFSFETEDDKASTAD